MVLPDEVAELEFYKALAHLESGRETDAYLEFKKFVRTDPYQQVEEGYYSPKTVEVYKKARREVLNEVDELISREDLTLLAHFSSAELLLTGYYLQTVNGYDLHILVFDTARHDVIFHERVPLSGDRVVDVERTDRVLSLFVACLPLKTPAEPPDTSEQGHLYLSTNFTDGVFLDSRLRASFFNYGVNVSGTYLLDEEFALFLKFVAVTSGTDINGDLLSGFSTLRWAVGSGLALRFDWFRLMIRTGLEFGYLTEHAVTFNVSCKAFGVDDPDCPSGDVVRFPGGWIFGIHADLVLGFQVVGPVFLTLSTDAAFFFLDLEDSGLNFPIEVSVGFDYRF